MTRGIIRIRRKAFTAGDRTLPGPPNSPFPRITREVKEKAALLSNLTEIYIASFTLDTTMGYTVGFLTYVYTFYSSCIVKCVT